MRSSTSTVSGKKSSPSFGCLDAVVAESTTVSSSRIDEGGAGGLAGQPAGLEPDFVYAKFAVVDDGFGAVHTLHG